MDIAAEFLALLQSIDRAAIKLDVVFQLAVGARLPPVLRGRWLCIAVGNDGTIGLRILCPDHKASDATYHVRMDIAADFFARPQRVDRNIFQLDDVL
jgi:hypothetical protein